MGKWREVKFRCFEGIYRGKEPTWVTVQNRERGHTSEEVDLFILSGAAVVFCVGKMNLQKSDSGVRGLGRRMAHVLVYCCSC